MTRYEDTFKWLSKIFKKIIKLQQAGALIFDEDNNLCHRFEIKGENIAEIDPATPKCRVMYYGDGWVDEKTETKKYWKNKLSKWRYIEPQNLKKLDLGE